MPIKARAETAALAGKRGFCYADGQKGRDDEMAEYHVVMTEVHKKTHQETLTDWRVILKKDLLSGEWMITSYGEG